MELSNSSKKGSNQALHKQSFTQRTLILSSTGRSSSGQTKPRNSTASGILHNSTNRAASSTAKHSTGCSGHQDDPNSMEATAASPPHRAEMLWMLTPPRHTPSSQKKRRPSTCKTTHASIVQRKDTVPKIAERGKQINRRHLEEALIPR